MAMLAEEAAEKQLAARTARKLRKKAQKGEEEQEDAEEREEDNESEDREEAAPTRQEAAKGPSNAVWIALLLGFAMLVINEIVGTNVGPGFFLAVFVYVLFTAIIPVIGIPIGALIILSLLLRHSQQFAAKLALLTGATPKVAPQAKKG